MRKYRLKAFKWFESLYRILDRILTELFIKGGNLSNCLDLITQSYFAVPKNITINSTHYFIMKIPIIPTVSTNCI